MTPTAFEQRLAHLLLAADPVAALHLLLRDPSLDGPQKNALLAVDEDGLRVSALLVAKLRFERLMRGCPDAELWFERDPASFAQAFREYHHSVLPTAYSPPHEARLFLGWCATQE